MCGIEEFQVTNLMSRYEPPPPSPAIEGSKTPYIWQEKPEEKKQFSYTILVHKNFTRNKSATNHPQSTIKVNPKFFGVESENTILENQMVP